MSLPNAEFLKITKPWDVDFFRAFDEHLFRFFVLLRHRRSRKSTAILNLLIREAASHPKHQYAHIFPIHKEAVKTVWRNPKMLFNYLPDKREMNWVANETDKFVKFANGSHLWLFGSDEPNNLRGPDYDGVGLDEWSYMKKSVWEAVIQPIIRVGGNRFAIFGYTPNGQNHGLDTWNDAGHLPGWWRQELKASQSGIIPASELVELKATMPKWLYDQEYECLFITDEERTLITSAMIEALRSIETYGNIGIKRILSIDPATDGDECPLMALENCKQGELKIMHDRDTMKIVAEAMTMCSRLSINDIVIDVVGLGQPIYDRLNELSKKCNLRIHAFDSRGEGTERLLNKKAVAWWYVGQQIRNQNVPYITDSETRRQLCSVRYDLQDSSGLLKLVPKAATKKILGNSPDRADAYVMGVYQSQFIPCVGESQSWDELGDVTGCAKSYGVKSAFC